MFTGLIEKVSVVENIAITSDGARISFYADFNDTKIGDSIAINGACLSVVKIEKNLFSADIMKETLNLTNLKHLKKGGFINLERAMKLTDRLDGHIVLGHVDCVSKIESIKEDGFSKRIKFNCSTDLIIKKGSIAVNGVSLTVADLSQDGFEVSLIPETIKNTNLKDLKTGDLVNIEFDMMGKYIQKFISKNEKKEITLEFLKENGF